MIWIIAVALVMNGAGQAIIDVDVDVDEGRPSHRHLPLAVRGEVGWRCAVATGARPEGVVTAVPA